MLIAQLSDFHVVPVETEQGKLMGTEAYFEAAVAHIQGLETAPDIIVGTGDLVDSGSRDEYDLLLKLLEPLQVPVYLLPGNHDERETMRGCLRGAGHSYLPEQGFLQYTVDLGELRLVALDTLIPGAPGGLLDRERLDWLDARLSETSMPTLVLQHHPPFVTGIAHMDRMGLSGMAEEEQVIAKHPHVERVLCGHLHRTIIRRFGNTIASTGPSTAHAVELDLREPGRLAVVGEPPACVLHDWRGGSLVSHTSYIGDYGPAHVIYD